MLPVLVKEQSADKSRIFGHLKDVDEENDQRERDPSSLERHRRS